LGPIKQKYIYLFIYFLFILNKFKLDLFNIRFIVVSDLYKPKDDGSESQVFISQTFDATSHFETTCTDVVDIFRRGTGEDFDFSKVKLDLNEDQ